MGEPEPAAIWDVSAGDERKQPTTSVSRPARRVTVIVKASDVILAVD